MTNAAHQVRGENATPHAYPVASIARDASTGVLCRIIEHRGHRRGSPLYLVASHCDADQCRREVTERGIHNRY